MTTINHHLDDATILALAAGTLPEAHRIVAIAHAAYCKHCHSALRAAETLGGQILTNESGVSVSANCRTATLAKLDGVTPASRPAAARPEGELPAVLSRLLGNEKLDDLNWKKKAPGVAMIDLPLSKRGKTRLQLVRLAPNRAVPEHGHGGEELTLILRGSLVDHTGTYLPGDIADLDEDIDHQPVAGSHGECICLIAIEAPARFKTFLARLAQPFIGI